MHTVLYACYGPEQKTNKLFGNYTLLHNSFWFSADIERCSAIKLSRKYNSGFAISIWSEKLFILATRITESLLNFINHRNCQSDMTCCMSVVATLSARNKPYDGFVLKKTYGGK